MTLKITLVNEDVYFIRGVYDWNIKDNIINIYSHTSRRDVHNNVYSDWMRHYKIDKDNVKDIQRTEGEDADVL